MNEARWEQLSDHLDVLLDLDEAARERHLQQIEVADAELANRLRRLLALETKTGLLDGDVARAAPTVMTHLLQPDDALAQSGRRIGHCRLVERIGTGGMGEVWRGERVDDFEQAVAIKLIRPLLDSPSLRERFARERRILARLDHPNIARLLDGGVAEDGTPWYAMEFVRGTDIVRYANEQALSVRERVQLLLQVCDAVAHAQSQLVVHRDLKPSNILVDAQGRVRVLDFGIARLLDDSAAEKLTGTGMRMFSPAYAAPEQIRGEAVGTAADVFALGAVLYELLAGEPPHPQRSVAPERLLAELAAETAPRPSQALKSRGRDTGDAKAATTARELAGDLDTIAATALQPDAQRRYTGAAQLAEDLRRWLDGRPIAAQRDTAGYRMKKFVTRHRIAVGSASAVLLALLAGLALALWQADVARDAARRADAEAVRAKAQAERTRKVKAFLVSIFVQADPMRRTQDSPETVAQAFDVAIERARTELASDPVLQADVLDDFGEILANQGKFGPAKALFEQAVAVAEKEYGAEHPVLAESLTNLGVVSLMSRDSVAGAPYLERAVAILERDDGGDHKAQVTAISALAAARQQQNRLSEAAELSRHALALDRRYSAPDDMELAVRITNVAILDLNDEHLAQAEAGFLEAMHIVEARQGADSPNLWPNLSNLADIQYRRGQLAQEAATEERALKIAQTHFPPDHPWVADSLIEVGRVRVRNGDLVAGEAAIREGIAIYEKLQSPRVVIGLRQLGAMQAQRDDDTTALASLERGWLECQSENASIVEQHCVILRAERAELLAETGRAEEALHEADAALAQLAPRPGLSSEKSRAQQARAAALAALQRHEEARIAQNAAVALLETAYGTEHPETRRAREVRASLD